MEIKYFPKKGQTLQKEEEEVLPKKPWGETLKSFFAKLDNKNFVTMLFELGVFLAGTVIFGLILKKDLVGLIKNPAFLVFTGTLVLVTMYNYLTGKNMLNATFRVLKWEIITLCAILLVPWAWGQIKSSSHSSQSMVPALPLGYVSGDDDFSLDAGESKTVSFKPGVKTDWSVDTKKERCGNDSLMVIIKTETSLDTLRSWKPNQNLPNGAYYGLTMIALAPMDSIKLKIRQRNG